MSIQSLKFIDYFVICGLNTETGLESDQLLGEYCLTVIFLNLIKCNIDAKVNCRLLLYFFDSLLHLSRILNNSSALV